MAKSTIDENEAQGKALVETECFILENGLKGSQHLCGYVSVPKE